MDTPLSFVDTLAPFLPATAPAVRARLERARAALCARFPELAAQLPARPELEPVVRDGEVVDVGLGGGALLYRGDARAVSAAQVDAFLRQPVRACLAAANTEDLSAPLGRAFAAQFSDEVRRLGIDAAPRVPEYDGACLIVFGVGLGYHLPALIRETRAGQVILVEPHPALLGLSGAALDWAALLEGGSAAGDPIAFHLVTDRAPEAIARAIVDILNAGHGFLADGMVLFAHYPEPALLAARDQLEACRGRVLRSFGFFEDECMMLANTLANLESRRAGRVRLVTGPRRPVRREPVFLVGAGPSLDRDAADLRRLRPGAVVISCGTGLQACLRHGVVPDLHVECENVAETPALLAHAAGTKGPVGHNFAGITLVAALTVDPRVPPMFDDALLYFRPGTAPTRALAAAGDEMLLAVPTAVNAAFRLAIQLGFAEFFLFGADFGSRDLERLHALGSAYQEFAYLAEHDRTTSLPEAVPGNFGGTVHTSATYQAGLEFAAALIRAAGVTVVNCSDGAAIAGARPRRAATLRLPRLKDGPRPVIDALVGSCRRLDAPDRPLTPDRAALAVLHRSYIADVRALLACWRERPPDIVGLWRALTPRLDPGGYGGMAMMSAGTLVACTRFAAFVLMRLPAGAPKAALFQSFLTLLDQTLAEMEARVAGLLAGLLAGEPGPCPG